MTRPAKSSHPARAATAALFLCASRVQAQATERLSLDLHGAPPLTSVWVDERCIWRMAAEPQASPAHDAPARVAEVTRGEHGVRLQLLVQPGSHVVEVRAPWRSTFRRRVRSGIDASHVDVTLESSVADPEPSAETHASFPHGEAPYGWHGLVGLHLSGTFGRAAGGRFNLGAEASVAFVADSFAWIGAYLDGVYAFGAKETRLSVGPEVGFLCLGLDGGYLLQLGNAGPRHGGTLRVMLTLGIISGFVRSSWLLGSEPDAFGEAGVLIKAPFELK